MADDYTYLKKVMRLWKNTVARRRLKSEIDLLETILTDKLKDIEDPSIKIDIIIDSIEKNKDVLN